jgi:AraC-like DNA-binding protein
MRTSDLAKPSVPISYVLMTLGLAEQRGVSRDAMLSGMAISARMLNEADARIGLLDYGRLCIRAMQLTRDPALGYEFGLHNRVTDHGFVGFGMMSQGTLLDAVQFAIQYFIPLRLPGWNLRLLFEGSQAVIDAHETVPYGVLRQYAMDMLLVALWSMVRPLLPKPAKVELWFDCPRPAYYAKYRQKLPRCRFGMGAIQLRMPAEYLSRPIGTANPVTAKLISGQCERELALLGPVEEDDVLPRVRASLINERGRYLDLEGMAARLHLSTRTLIRRLASHGISFQQLLDEARHRDSVRLLEDPSLTLAVIANRLGYSTAANFSRAFQKWTGLTPGRFRARRESPTASSGTRRARGAPRR